MSQYTILCVDDEREVLDSILSDLEKFGSHFDLEGAESADEAKEIVDELAKADKQLALIFCDHIMPGENGVDLLIDLKKIESTKRSRKVLVTGQAGHQDTINAINQAGLDYYISKPWEPETVQKTAVDQLTRFVLENDPNPMIFSAILDAKRIFESIHERGYGDT